MNRHRGPSSRCRKILKLVNYGIHENFTYLSRSSFPIDGISDLKEVNSEPDDFITSAPLIVVNLSPNDNNTSPPNLPTNDILDISHNVIESLLPEMEYPTPLQSVNNNDDLQITDNSIVMTPSTQQKIDFIATPTVLYINNDYYLRNISDLEGFLHSIETQNISQDIVPTESKERPVTPIEPLTKKRKIDPNLWKDRKNKTLKNSGKSYESVRTKKQNVEKSIGATANRNVTKRYSNIRGVKFFKILGYRGPQKTVGFY
ncbi:unnamed protein product [Parnassius apollo]|uniref:(apollo) hypothetical protein n=1 Tax=Parnassius apollo TaxID=110799 RepID=A0A8S3X847_PARAO|nr:unnamed protein product [Parnassius apollo]